jgi:hypothetical protein
MKKNFLLALLALAGTAEAYEAKVTKGQLAPDLETLLGKASAETGLTFEKKNFLLIEERNLATSNYKFYVQTNSLIPVAQTAVRIWTDSKTNELILAEMHLDEATKKADAELKLRLSRAHFTQGAMKSKQLATSINAMVSSAVERHDTDARIISIKSQDMWLKGDLVREVVVRGRRGLHRVRVSLFKNQIIEQSYQEFPQSERFTTLKANVYPMYEEVEGTTTRLNHEVRDLKYIYASVHEAGTTPMGPLENTKFLEANYSPLLAETAYGETKGFWSEAVVRRKIESYVSTLPQRENSFENGLLLQGKFATINLHPAVKEAFNNVTFPLVPTTNHLVSWVELQDGTYEAKPLSGLSGKAITSETDLLSRIPVRLDNHDAVSYINSGVDEAQVYYGVTTLMETLAEMGFTDPELSTKPFHAFLYDPDIGMKDNAYYTDNTINFTTYSSEAPNLARDNPTIWHELGHGVMDRLMGSHLGFADSNGGYGGLSEGMADFVAKLVVEYQTNSEDFPGKYDFRIMNETGFYLTNEYHDDGESYGGAMNDMLTLSLRAFGRQGLIGLADLTMEAMRLTRNHPALSARAWFEHMAYADELGSSFRSQGQFKSIIDEALASRNFAFRASFKPASMRVKYGDTLLTNASQASRDKPIISCGKDGVVSYDLNVSLTSGDAEFIKFPAIVKVEYKKGALQGAIKWEGEEVNPQTYRIASAEEVLTLPIRASLECDFVNQPDGSCKDYAYVQVFNESSQKPIAKKRFYLKLNKAQCK